MCLGIFDEIVIKQSIWTYIVINRNIKRLSANFRNMWNISRIRLLYYALINFTLFWSFNMKSFSRTNWSLRMLFLLPLLETYLSADQSNVHKLQVSRLSIQNRFFCHVSYYVLNWWGGHKQGHEVNAGSFINYHHLLNYYRLLLYLFKLYYT